MDAGLSCKRKEIMKNKIRNAGRVSTNKVQSYTYASMYAIQISPIANDECGVKTTVFVSSDSQETVWACDAMSFDTAEQALAKLIALELPRKKASDGIVYPRVVKMRLKCDIKSATDELSSALLG